MPYIALLLGRRLLCWCELVRQVQSEAAAQSFRRGREEHTVTNCSSIVHSMRRWQLVGGIRGSQGLLVLFTDDISRRLRLPQG